MVDPSLLPSQSLNLISTSLQGGLGVKGLNNGRPVLLMQIQQRISADFCNTRLTNMTAKTSNVNVCRENKTKQTKRGHGLVTQWIRDLETRAFPVTIRNFVSSTVFNKKKYQEMEGE